MYPLQSVRLSNYNKQYLMFLRVFIYSYVFIISSIGYTLKYANYNFFSTC